MPGDVDLDLLLAAETAEWEEIDARVVPPASKAAIPAPPLTESAAPYARSNDERLDDVTVREDDPEETLGDEDASEPLSSDEPQVADSETVVTSAQLAAPITPDLRLEGFARNSTALKNRHVGPLLNLARRIAGSAGDHRSVRRVQVIAISSFADPRSRDVAEGRGRAVASALREAVDRIWPGLASRIEFATSVRAAGSSDAAVRTPHYARRAVEASLEFSESSNSLAFPSIVHTDHHRSSWQFPSEQHAAASSNAASEPAHPLSAHGYFFVPATEATPWRWICSLEITLQSDDPHLPHSEYCAKLNATGLLVSPRHILTAAHCVFSRLREGSVREMEAAEASLEDPLLRAKSIAVFPGRSGGAFPLGSYMIRDPRCVRSSARWRVSRAANIESDFALLTLDRPLAMGSWGKPPYHITALPDDQLKGAVVYTAGYPNHGDPPCNEVPAQSSPSPRVIPEDTQWSTFGSVTELSVRSFQHDLPFRAGQDGSPIWVQQGKDHKLGGLMLGKNRALRLTSHTIKILRSWVAQDGCWSAS